VIDLDAIFSESGVLAGAVPGFRARPSQLELARSIAQAIEWRECLVAEAGTGTGKTFAYLVPVLLSGVKTIVSTGTKTLQDQLFKRDIPVLRAALRVPVTVALLKGRANYLCHHRLERTVREGRLANRQDADHLRRVERFAATTTTGDRGELADVPEDSSLWSLVTSTRDNCLGQECAHHKSCFVLAARREAQSADVVVVNHHLFFADVMLRDEGAAELLPACNAVVFDEAHQLPETATLFFGESVSTAQVQDLARDARSAGLAAARDFAALPAACDALDKAGRDLRLVFGRDEGRFALEAARQRREFDPALAASLAALHALRVLLEDQQGRSEDLGDCARRAAELEGRLARWQAGEDPDSVRWVETYTHALHLNATRLSIAETMQRELEAQPRAWIFTSATLSVQGDFAHYRSRMGLEHARCMTWESPFDFPTQGLLYVPKDLPDPNSADYAAAVVATLVPVLRASRGRAFCLFTSLRAMARASELLRAALEREGLAFPLLTQGEATRTDLLERFRRLGNAVLVGSQSFWEGVDVKGDALSVVAIDKLPFAPPDDPVLAARIERMKAEGRNPFMEYQLPSAVISLKQGAGRLIRDEADRGVLVICDPRLVSKPYGRKIWQSLPPMRRTREVGDVERFFAIDDTAAAHVASG
jgi:ATP-dependent DNA helicase DinG